MVFKTKFKKTFTTFIISILILLLSNISVFAFNINDKINIYNTSDIESRNQIDITNIKNTNYINFHVDKNWWDQLSKANKAKVDNFINILSSEFEYNIYIKILKIFPDVRQWLSFEDRIDLVFTPMSSGIQGYVRWDDFNTKEQSKTSNDGNIIYMNSLNVVNPSISNNVLFSFFSHELMHLITYHEKNLKYNLEEETWLEELRSEYLANYLGYNKTKDSYLNFRLQNGVSLTNINLVDWDNTSNSYSLINLFSIYLANRFSESIIFGTLKSNYIGISSINHFLSQNGYSETFKDIYQDWVIANIINDCSIDKNYCYENIGIHINIPGTSFYLPLQNNSVLSISDSLSNYQTKYQKIVGGSDNLEIIIENSDNNIFKKLPYILIDKEGNKTLNFFDFKSQLVQKAYISNYSQKYVNIIIIPMFASSNDVKTQLFKWHINSTQRSGDIPTKPVVRTTATSKEESTTTTTTQPDNTNTTPIIINIISPEKIKPIYNTVISSIKNFFLRIWSWVF